MPSFTHKREYRILTELLKDTRLQVGMTQEDVASAWGTTQSVISKVERGERRLDIIQFIEYCEILGLPAEAEFARLLSALQPSSE
ncbi:helix-turn-helix transcriptional regulator [Xanthomonas euroxanthea]